MFGYVDPSGVYIISQYILGGVGEKSKKNAIARANLGCKSNELSHRNHRTISERGITTLRNLTKVPKG
jgi:hypothetical protein